MLVIRNNNMKTIKILNIIFAIALGFFALMYGIDIFTTDRTPKSADTILYTEEYCQDITGFNDVIPLEINMVNGKIEHINILDNRETPRFMDRVTDGHLVENFYGLTPAEAISLDIDAVSGATYSSNAIIKSVKARMAAYEKECNPNPWTWQLIGIVCCAVILSFLSIVKNYKSQKM